MNGFYSIYRLLRKLPFSIRGYNDAQEEVDDFFYKLCEDEIIKRKPHISFVSYSYAKLNDINSWKTSSFSPVFFFHALKEKYSLLSLNLYYFIRRSLFAQDKSKNEWWTDNVAISLSRLFIKDIGFRVAYRKNKNWHISYLQGKRTLSIEIPLERVIQGPKDEDKRAKFKKALSQFLANVLKKLESKSTYELPIAKKKSSTYYKSSKEFDESLVIFEELTEFRKVFKEEEELKSLKKELFLALKHFHRHNPGVFSETNFNQNLNNWVELFFQVLLISLIYDCWVEYFPSVCGIVEEEESREYRNLGGIILGYQYEDEISLDERAVFRLISDRISAVVSAQTIFEMDRNRRREANLLLQRSILQDFMISCLFGEVDHSKKPLTQRHLEALNYFIAKHKENFKIAGLQNFASYCISTYKEDQYIDKGLFTCVHVPSKEIKNKNKVYQFSNNSIKLILKGNEEPIVNIVVVNDLIEAFINQGDEQKVSVYQPSEFKDSIFIRIEGGLYNLNDFISSLERRKGGSNQAGSLGQFFIDNYDDMMISCNILLRNGTKLDEIILNFEDELYSVKKVDSTKLRCRKTLYCKELEAIVYQVKFRSI